jgi:hypothetical protein
MYVVTKFDHRPRRQRAASGRASERNRLTLRTARSGRAKRKRKTAPDPDFKYTKDDVAAPPLADSAASEPQDADDSIGE